MRRSSLMVVWVVLPWALAASVRPSAGADQPAPFRCGADYLRQAGGAWSSPAAAAARTAAFRGTPAVVSVGTGLDFLVAGDSYLRPGTCQYVGDHCYVFVEDAQWDANGGPVYQDHVDSIGRLFDRATPADPARGIYELLTASFGPAPDVDGHDRVFIFIVEIADARVVGFFDPYVATFGEPGLRRDTIYLDASMLRSRPNLVRGTLAHEFQHLVHFGADPDEEDWVNEGLSGHAEALAGFPETDTSMVPAFLSAPDWDLTVWPQPGTATAYGASYLFVSYLAQGYGAQAVRALVGEPRNGIAGIDAMLAARGQAGGFEAVWADWILANYAGPDPWLGYRALGERRIRSYPAPPLPCAAVEGRVGSRWGTVAMVLRPAAGGPAGISVELAGEPDGRLRVWGYAMRGAEGEAIPVELGADQSGGLTADSVDSLAVVVGRTSLAGGRFWLTAAAHAPSAITSQPPAALPRRAELSPAWPNPFNGAAVIPFALAAPTAIELSVFDVLGRRVARLAAGSWPAGEHQVRWTGKDEHGRPLASGAYVVQLRAGSGCRCRPLVLVR